MFDSVQIYNRIERILCEKGISDRQMMAEAGLKRGVLDNMKKGSMPSADKLALIADYLGVSVDDLLGRESATEKNRLLKACINKITYRRRKGENFSISIELKV